MFVSDVWKRIQIELCLFPLMNFTPWYSAFCFLSRSLYQNTGSFKDLIYICFITIFSLCPWSFFRVNLIWFAESNLKQISRFPVSKCKLKMYMHKKLKNGTMTKHGYHNQYIVFILYKLKLTNFMDQTFAFHNSLV